MVDGNLELQVFSYSNPKTYIDVLPNRSTPAFQDAMKQQGAGSFSVQKNDPKVLSNPDLLHYRNVVKAVRDGVVEGAMILGTRSDTTVGSNEQASKLTVASGEGLKGWFRDATIHPYLPVSSKSGDQRLFNWASPLGFDYSGSEWGYAYVQANYELTPPKSSKSPFKYRPAQWPDLPQAKWVWGRAKPSTNYNQPAGDNYFRYDFTVSAANAGAAWSIFAAAESTFIVYLDGAEVMAHDGTTGGSITVARYDIDAGTLQAGYHTVGIKVTNSGSAASPAGLIASFWMQGDATKNTKASVWGYTGMPTTASLQANVTAANIALNSRVQNLKSLGVKKLTPTNTVYANLKAALAWSARVTSYRKKQYLSTPKKPASRKSAAAHAYNAAVADQRLKQNRVSNFLVYLKQYSALNAAKAAYNKQASQGTLGWKVNDYPATEPGWTAGNVILTLLAEAKARGVKFPNWLTPTFTATKDSRGVAWDRSVPWTFNVGDDYLTAFSAMEELGCDIWINPATLELNVYGNRGSDKSVQNGTVQPVILQEAQNLTEATTTGVAELKSALLVQTNDGWIEQVNSDTTVSSLYGRLEGSLSTSAPKGVAVTISNLALTVNGSEQTSSTYSIQPIPGAWPFIDFNVGDYVLAPNKDGNLVSRRVMSITATETTDNGAASYVLEFDTIFQTEDNLLTQWLAVTAGGGLSVGYQNAGLPKSLTGAKVKAPVSDTAKSIPASPVNVNATTTTARSAQTGASVAQTVITWDPSETTTDGYPASPIARYNVFAQIIDDPGTSDPYTGDDGTEDGDSTPDPDYTGGTDDLDAFDPTTDDDSDLDTTKLTLVATVDGAVTTASVVSDPAQTVNYYVQAVMDDTPSILTTVNQVAVATDPVETVDLLAAPSAPTLSTSLGTVTASWDGLMSNTGDYYPASFNFLSLYISTASDGSFAVVGQPLTSFGNIVVANLTVGSTYYFYTAATDVNGVVGTPSATVSITVDGVKTMDLDQEISNQITAIQTKADNASAAASSANTAAGNAQTTANSANTTAQQAAGLVAGKGKTIYSASAPTGDDANVNNLWISTPDNIPHTYDGSHWNAVTDSTAVNAASAAASAQSAANAATAAATAAQTAAGQAQTTANGKNTVFYTNTAPAGTAHANGDVWFNPAQDNAVSTWSTSSNTWVATPIGNAALSTTVTNNIATAGANAQTAISNAATAQTAADASAIAANAAALLSGSSSNPIWANWTGAFPYGTSVFGTGYSPTKEQTIVRTPPNALRLTSINPGDEVGVHLDASLFPAMANVNYVTVVLDFYLVSGDLSRTGVLVDWDPSGGDRGFLPLSSVVPNAKTGQWYHVSQLVERPSDNTSSFTNMTGYLLSSWSGFNSNGALPDIIFDSLIFRASTTEEITALSASRAAAAAQTAANNAQNSANTAQATADGKNKVTYSYNAPTTTDIGVGGDTWFQIDGGSGSVIGFWRNGGGGLWAPQPFADTVIANLDAGKITSGYISTDRLAANSITAAQIATGTITAASGVIGSIDAATITVNKLTGTQIAGQTITAQNMVISSPQVQLLQSPGFEAAPYFLDLSSFTSGTDYTISTVSHSGTSSFAVPNGSARTFPAAQAIPVNPGEVYQLTYWQANTSNYVSPSGTGITVRTTATAGTALISQTHPTSTANVVWTQFTLTFKVPAGLTNIYVQIRDGGHTAGTIYFDDFSLLCLTPGGSLVVDGQIIAQSMSVNSVNANAIQANAVTANALAAGSIDGKLITGAVIQTAATGARLVLSGSTLLGYGAGSGGQFISIDPSGGGAIKLSSLDTGSQPINGVYWNSGSLIFTNPTSKSGNLSAPGIGWFNNDGAGATIGVPKLVFGSPNTATDHGQPHFNGVALYGNSSDMVQFAGGSDGRAVMTLNNSGVNITSAQGTTYSGPSLNIPYQGNVYLTGSVDNGTYSYGSFLILVNGGGWGLYPSSNTAGLDASKYSVSMGTSGYWGSQLGIFQNPDSYQRVASGRAAIIASNGTFGTAASTEKVKYDIEPIVMDDAMNAQVMSVDSKKFFVDYDFRETPQKNTGFVAQDLHNAGLTEWVDYGADLETGEMNEEPESVWYDRVPAIQWAWLKYLQNKIDALQDEVASLKGKS